VESFKKHFNNFARSHKLIFFTVFFISIIVTGSSAFALSMVLPVTFYRWGMASIENLHWMVQNFAIAFIFATSYLLYGLSVITVCPIINRILFLPKILKPFRGDNYSFESMAWFLHNALTYIPRYSFLEWFTPSPLNVLFYRGMGMKVGKNSHINTTNISDPCLIEIGDNVTIGGSATLLAHYSQGGYLVLAPLKIGNKVTVGLRAIVFGDSIIEDKCMVGPNVVIKPKQHLKEGTRVKGSKNEIQLV